MKFSKYTIKNIDEVLKGSKTSENGLSKEGAKNRLKIYGFNEVKVKEVGLLDIFLRQFKTPFTYLLFIAAIIAFLVRERIDSYIILVFVLINISLGFFQEARAHRAVALLKKYIPSKTRVLREGKEMTIDKKFLVPGDVVLLELGDIVPADMRIIKTENFLVDESILSGESFPVPKISQPLSKETKEIFEAKNIVFAGTAVISGAAEGIVIGTGRETAFGEITKLVSGITRESAYERDLLNFSRLILKIVVITIIFLFLASLIIKGAETFFESLLFSIALIVSIIPEALPVVITLTLSEGALKLAREKVVVKRLSAVEDLGDIEVLCTDKTGTLTRNKLMLENVYAQDKEKCLLYGLLTSSYMREEIESSLNTFDSALFEKSPQEIRQSLKNFKVISEIPFDPVRLRNSTLVKDKDGKLILIIKGAPEIILKLSSRFNGDFQKEQINRKIEREGREGKRILAVAFREFDTFDKLSVNGSTTLTINKNQLFNRDEKNLIFLGYFSFIDPLKDTAKESIDMAKQLGVQIKMITGDSKEVAGYVAKEAGLIENQENVILGEQLSSLPKDDFEKACQDFSIFARVSPETKLKIINALQKRFEVGFLGEGINDTPALKSANVAIVVPEAVDVTREVADVILLDKDLRVIIGGIKNGRNIFSNINKYIKCVLASNFGNFYSIAVIALFITFLPMLPIQILLGNLLSDFPLIAIATDQVDMEELRKPKLYQLRHFIWLVTFLAMVSTIFDFIFFGIFYKTQPAIMQTLWFIESILTEISLIFVVRTRHFFLNTKRPSFTLMFLTLLDGAFILSLPFTNFGKEFFHFISPPTSALLTVLSLVISYFFISEMVKLIYFRYWKIKHLNKINKL